MYSISEHQKHIYEWVEKMGWAGRNKTVLEQLMLVVSECGEAANEARGETLTDNFRLELADIVIRVMGLAENQNIDLEQAIIDKMKINKEKGKKPGRLK